MAEHRNSSSGPPGTMETTATLIARIREGDTDARERLFARYLAPLRRWAHGRLPAHCRDLVDTDDLVQITMVKTLDKVRGFEPRWEGAFLAYLRRGLVNQIRDQIRHASRRPEKAELGEEIREEGPSPLEKALGQEALESYEAALVRLPEMQQEAVVMRIELGLTYPEIAAALGSPSPNAARMAVSRALVRLAEEIHAG